MKIQRADFGAGCFSGVAMSDFLKALEHEASTLEAELARDPRYIKLQEVKRLRALYAPHLSDPGGAVVSSNQSLAAPRPLRPITSGVGLDAVNATRALLQGHNKPMLTREILEYLELEGIVFGGTSAQATLASILSRTPEFESKGGRVGWVLKSVEPTGGVGETIQPPVDYSPLSNPVKPGWEGGA